MSAQNHQHLTLASSEKQEAQSQSQPQEASTDEASSAVQILDLKELLSATLEVVEKEKLSRSESCI